MPFPFSPKSTNPSKIPTRVRHPPSPSPAAPAQTSFLSPKGLWSPTPCSLSPTPRPGSRQIAKYQLKDPGVVPGSPPPIKRIRVPSSSPAMATSAVSISKTTPPSEKPSATIYPGTVFHSRTSPAPGPDSSTPTRKGAMGMGGSRIPIPLGGGSGYARPSTGTGKLDNPSSLSSKPPSGIPRPAGRNYQPTRGLDSISPRSSSIPNSPISTCATVAPAFIATQAKAGAAHAIELDRIGSDTSTESNTSSYSAASALARHRHNLPAHHDSVSGSGSSMTRVSSTTSYSSASSLARHRRVGSRQFRLRTTSQAIESAPMSATSSGTGTGVDQDQEVTLVWEPDPESLATTSDPAEELWREIEARLNGRYRSSNTNAGGRGRERERDERGQWVLTARTRAKQERGLVYDGEETGAGAGAGMEKQLSEFTVSAYLDPEFSTPRPRSRPRPASSSVSVTSSSSSSAAMDGTALAMFDMSGPLTYSRSIEGSTPANTPFMEAGTIHRAPRVTKVFSHSSSGSGCGWALMGLMGQEGMMRKRSDSSCAVVDDIQCVRRGLVEETKGLMGGAVEEEERGHSHDPVSPFRTGEKLRAGEDEGSRLIKQRQYLAATPYASEAIGPDRYQTIQASSRVMDLSSAQQGQRMRGLCRLDSQIVAARSSLRSRNQYTEADLGIEASLQSELAHGVKEKVKEGRNTPRHTLVKPKYRSSDREPESQDWIEDRDGHEYSYPDQRRQGETKEISTWSSESRTEPKDEIDDEDEIEKEAGLGLGLGMGIHLDSIYSLQMPTPSPLQFPMQARPPSDRSPPSPIPGPDSVNEFPPSTSRKDSSDPSSVVEEEYVYNRPDDLGNRSPAPASMNGEQLGGYEGEMRDQYRYQERPSATTHDQIRHIKEESRRDAKEEEEEMLCVTDLDTGHRVEYPINQLEERALGSLAW